MSKGAVIVKFVPGPVQALGVVEQTVVSRSMAVRPDAETFEKLVTEEREMLVARGHMKTTVEIADPLLDEATRMAEKSGCTLRDLIEVGLRHELDHRKRTQPGTSAPATASRSSPSMA